MTEKICPECNGEGVVDQGTEDERRCPTCNGSGIVPDDKQDSEEVWNTHHERAVSPHLEEYREHQHDEDGDERPHECRPRVEGLRLASPLRQLSRQDRPWTATLGHG
jgi:RecJ-like exonuclease